MSYLPVPTSLIGAFALAQFFATPWLGRLSDQWGRRPILLLSVFGSLLGFLMWAFAKPLGSQLYSQDVGTGALIAIGPILGAGLIDTLGTSAPGIFAFVTLTVLGGVDQGKLKALPDSPTGGA